VIYLATLPRVAALVTFAFFPATTDAAQNLSGFSDPPRIQDSRRLQEAKHRERHHERSSRSDWSTAQGPFQIIVSLAKQQITLYGQKGAIARADISTGMAGHPTPMGVFTVLSKAKWHESNIYSGAPMPYMQRITWSGIALHAGPRPGHPASHGCIRLPEDFAVRLFHTTKVGTRVIVTRPAAEPVAIEHAKLFMHKAPEEPAKPLAEVKVLPDTGLSLAAKTSGDQNSSPAAPVIAPDITGGAGALPAVKNPAPLRPISVFVSHKQHKIFVRQGFTPLLDIAVTIADPDRPLGTHVFTALAFKDDGAAFQWTVVSIPSRYHQSARTAKRHRRAAAEDTTSVTAVANATEALDRITVPPEAMQLISALISPGSSLIVSDNELSDETDADTDLIVLTP
jgi:lipoprotein-anchoring transpeptidase ErfK/SrfK